MYKELTRHNRQQWLLEALAAYDRDLSVEARREKYVAMGASPFRFFRGTSHLFWADFYNDWQLSLFGGSPATQTWLQGDAHVYNFGAIADHQGRVIYGLDDFDDAIVGDYQYDLWRLGISLMLDAQERGVEEKDARKQLYALGEGYLEGALGGEQPAPSGMTVDEAPPPLRKFLKKVATKQTRRKLLDKWTEVDEEGRRRFRRDHPKLEPATAEERRALVEALAHYRDRLEGALAGAKPVHFTIKDVARRLRAGTGSLGSRRFYVLIEGGGDGDHDDVILDVKEQSPPAACAQMTERERARYRELFSGEGERHAAAFTALSSHPDRYLGWLTFDGASFSVRERSPFKKDFPTADLTSNKKAKRMARIWGEILARHHRQAARYLNDGAPIFEQGIAGRLVVGEDRFLDLLADLAEHYAGCVGHDYAVFLENRERLVAGKVPD